MDNLQRRKVKDKKAARKEQTAALAAEREASFAQGEEEEDDDDDEYVPSNSVARKKKGFLAQIKWKYVIMLLLLTGTAVLPAALWVIDTFFAASSNAASVGISTIVARMGMTPTPKERLIKFYKKHNPEKVDEVPTLVHKYAGNYEKMIKILEAKYGDYGFFIGWQEDADFKKFMKKEAIHYFNKAQRYYRIYMPYRLRIAFWNMYYNISTILGPPINIIQNLIFSDGTSSSRGRSSRATSSSKKKSASRTRPSSTRRSSTSA
uniref:Uncharacterized protein n=1 Tax=Aureoumbra lagunensis TaxID=44058 RepID=A0A7S3JUU8_9STRA|mmetsp:Transcript_23405/g.30386  ORF Transcript_23405/g.30386 Transcript_23405/m.30386 type:complete len:263 (+) Transcript_23405:45-833(+)